MLLFVQMLIHKHLGRGLLVALLGFSAAQQSIGKTASQEGNVTLTIPQARQVALNALRSQNPRLTLHIAGGLLQRDARDSLAYFMIAQASQQLGEPNTGRRAAARAFQFSKSKEDKYASSQLAARLSYDAKRYTLAQYWLRRSVNFVQTPQQRQQIASDYKRLRAENPWNTQLRFSIAPSSNVNAGSDTNLSTIEGVPVVGILSRSAQALSGVVGVADTSTSYRFSQSTNHSAYVTGRIYSRQIQLSSAARRAVPAVRNKDFSATAVELGLKYVFRTGMQGGKQGEKRGGLSTLNAIIGKNWYGGDPSSVFSRLGYAHSLSAGKRTRLTFSGSYERRDYNATGRAPTFITRVMGSARHRFKDGGAVQFGLFANNTTSTWVNTSSISATAHLSYEMGNPIGPAMVSFGIGATYQDFSNYSVGFIVVPGGRQDSVAFASVAATFNTLDYAGFVPKVTLRAQKNNSNISRFDTTQLSVSIGIQSSF